MTLTRRSLFLCAGLISAIGLLGCNDDDDSASCTPGVNSCAGNMLITCDINGNPGATVCENGCNSVTNKCNEPSTQCDAATYPNSCANGILSTCIAGSVMPVPCQNGCNATGTACSNGSDVPVGPTKQCDPATYPVTCANNVLTKCVGNAIQTETCSNGCAADGKSCSVGGETDLTCKNGPSADHKKGDKYNEFVYTGCACDDSYVKTCGVVDGKEVAFTCYKNSEEYLPCEKCRIENNRYECGEGGSGNVTPVAGEGEVHVVDAKYDILGIQENSTATASLEKYGTEQISGQNDPPVETCATLSIEGSNTCSRSGSGSKLVLQGDILTKDKTYLGGSVVIENGKITSVGCNADTAGATVITCPNAVISAGFINAHDHITYSNATPGSWGAERFDHRHNWRTGNEGHKKVPGPKTNNNEVPELRQLMGGTTSIFGSGSVAGLTRNIDKKNQVTGASNFPTYDTFPLSDQGGTLATSGCSKYKLSGQFKQNYVYGPHIGEGISDAALNEFACLSDASKGLANQFSSKLAVIHGVSATPKYIKLFADTGAKLIWSPRTNVSLYGDTARVTVYDNMGVPIALGSDWIYSGSATMLREFQCVDFLNTYFYDKHFSDYDIWMMSTYNGALALGFEKYIGNIAPGLVADISVFKKGTGNKIMHRAVLEAENKDVTLVMIDGKLIYGDENIMTTGDKVNVCGISKKVDTKLSGSTKSYSEIDKAKAYDLFFCGTPANEPTCVPIRTRPKDTTSQGTTMYDGEYSDPNDIDGDGIPNDVDNCPTVFNPVRPEDKDASSKLGQGDWDGDGVGDVCDKAPMDKAVQ